MKIHYFLHYSYSNAPANKLQREVLQYFKSLDNKLIHAADLEATKELILGKIDALNAANPRCKAIELDIYVNKSSETILISGFEKLNFYIYPAQLMHTSTIAYHSLSNN